VSLSPALSRFRLINLRHLARQRLRSALSVAAIAVAASLIVTVYGIYGSLTGSIERFVSSLAGKAELEVTGVTDDGFDERLLARVAATPGVAAAVPVIRSPVVLAGHQATLFGFDQRARALGGELQREIEARQGAAPATLDGVFLGEGLARAAGAAAGQRVTVYSVVGGQRQATVLGIVTGDRARRTNQGFFAVAPLPLAQQLAGKPRRLDSILVVDQEGADPRRLEQRLTDVVGQQAVVASPRLRVEQATVATSLFQNATLFVAIMALAVAGFLVFNTLNMVALQRRQEFATLRALGGRRRAILGDFLAEAALLGLVGAAIGCPLGMLVARGLVTRLPSFLVASFDVRVGFVLPGYALPLAVVACLGTSLAAAWLPARRAVRVQPVEAMRPHGVLETAEEAERVGWLAVAAGLVLLAGGAVLALTVADERSFAAGGLFLVGCVLASYGTARLIAEGAGWLAALFGSSGRLAAASIERAPRRIWATTVIVAIGVAIAVSTHGATQNEISAVAANVASLADVDLFVQGSAADELPVVPRMPAAWRSTLEAVPGVARVGPGQFAYATVGRDRVVLQGIGGPSNTPAFRLADDKAQGALLTGSGAVVSRRFSLRHDLGVGDTVRLSTPKGIRSLPIVAEVDHVVAEGGLVALSLGQLQAWFERPGASFFELTLEPGANPGGVRAAVLDALAGAPFEVHVVTGQESVRGTESAVRQASSLSLAIQWVVAGAAALAVLNTLMISVVERRRELGIIRAVGASRRLLRRVVLCEAGAVGVLGGIIGVVVGTGLQYLGVKALGNVVGLEIPFEFVPITLAIAAGALLASLAGAIGPAGRAARLDLVEALSYE
jgi:putative ABC transport system permease protein